MLTMLTKPQLCRRAFLVSPPSLKYAFVNVSGRDNCRGSAMPDKQINSEGIIAGLYLGIAVTGGSALVAMGLVFAFM